MECFQSFGVYFDKGSWNTKTFKQIILLDWVIECSLLVFITNLLSLNHKQYNYLISCQLTVYIEEV